MHSNNNLCYQFWVENFARDYEKTATVKAAKQKASRYSMNFALIAAHPAEKGALGRSKKNATRNKVYEKTIGISD